MKKLITLVVIGSVLFLFSVQLVWASHPTKDIGINSPDAIIRGGTGNSPYQAARGDINGNGLSDFIVIGSTGGTVGGNKIYVGVFFDTTLASLNGRSFSSSDLLIKTNKQYPWASDVIKFHPMHWVAVVDLNQDGFDDIIFSLPIIRNPDGTRDEKGEVYVVLGNTRANLGTTWDFSTKPPSFTFFGRDPGDRAGFALATGDINGDGRKDLLIGAPQADGPNNAFIDGGEVYGITSINFSQSSMVLSESNVNLYIYGEVGQKYGYAITSGNLNGDINTVTGRPVDDVIVAPYMSPGGPVKMIFGNPTMGGSKRLSLNANWTSSYNLIPRYPNLIAGDLNKDGIDDLVASGAGESCYITYGSTSSISSSANVTIYSAHSGDHLGFSNVISDFDGDGFKDLAMLAPRARGQYSQYLTPVGEVHIVWGQMSRLPSVINLATESTHFSLYGSDGTGPTHLVSNFQGPWNSTYGYTFGQDLDGDGKSELFFGGSWNQNAYIYKIESRP